VNVLKQKQDFGIIATEKAGTFTAEMVEANPSTPCY
jgi:hypothetical protein